MLIIKERVKYFFANKNKNLTPFPPRLMQRKSDSSQDPFVELLAIAPLDGDVQSWTCFLNLGEPFLLVAGPRILPNVITGSRNTGSGIINEEAPAAALYTISKDQLILKQQWHSTAFGFENIESVAAIDVSILPLLYQRSL